ncbi:MAG TPA: pyridoxal-dependent decarboxylase [Acidimicrobiales bacterium]|nr:pyridoxal-dependent decarboxylase [Acidimicrobiales bacterium]
MDFDDFRADPAGLRRAVELLVDQADAGPWKLGQELPENGIGSLEALEVLASPVLGHSRDLGGAGFFAHMDPPTPWIAWVLSMWTASRNQNLLHPDTAPTARAMEETVVAWLAPFFGKSGGHMTPGSSIANLTALWAARESGAREIVASGDAHLSIKKAAHLLGLPLRLIEDWSRPGKITHSVVVVTAGTTSAGEVEPLDAAPEARWRHLDAAWAGPLRLSERHSHLLDGIDGFDSVSISAHKWLFQPKESALVLFNDHEAAHASIAIDGAYLAVPNVGVLGSHGATAAHLLATLLAFGRSGVAALIDHCMGLAEELHELVEAHDELVARSQPHTGIVCWRHRTVPPEDILRHLPPDVFVSSTTIAGEAWLRSVAANPLANPPLVIEGVLTAATHAT